MQQRHGTKDVGMEYQFKVITFVAASLIANDDVEDFVIFSNADNIPGFDDLIVKVWFKSSHQAHVYLGQVKHRHSKINFDGEKHKLADYVHCINKIIRDKDQIQILSDVPTDNIEFWFYSNNFVNKVAKLEQKGEQSEQILCNIAPDKEYKSIVRFKKPADCFKLIAKENSLYDDIFHRFHLFLNQSNNSKIDYDILNLLELSKESTERIIKYVDKFLNIPKITGLTKSIFETEVFNIHLSSITVKATQAIEMNAEQARLWNKITLTHDVTIIDDIPDVERSVFGCFWQQINDIYDCQFKWNDCIGNMGRLTDNFDVQKFVDRTKLQQIRYWLASPDTIDALLIEIWKYYDLPRILKPTTNLGILQKFNHLQKKFIIIGNAKKKWNEINSYRLRIFTDIASICSPQLKIDLLSNVMVSLQGRNPASINNIFDGDEGCMKLLTCHHVLDLIKKRKIYLENRCFEETELLVFIIIDDSSSETINVNTLRSNGNTNIFIRSNYDQVDMYIREIKSLKIFDNYTLHVVLETDYKLEYIKGKCEKLKNFLIDEDGQSIYATKNLEPIPIIGKRLGLADNAHINRHLRKAAVDLTLLDEEDKIICLVYGDINSLKSNIKQIIQKSNNVDFESASAIERSVIITVPEKLVKQYWTRLCAENHQLILLKASNGYLEMIQYKHIGNLRKYIMHSDQTFTEDEFFKEITNNLIVISGVPGMGKSYLLHKLSEICDERDYALFLNLSDYRRDFQQSTKALLEDPLNFLFKKLEMSKFQNLIKGIYDAHKGAGRLIVFLDSFDEILPFHEIRVLDMLERIINLNIKVIICSRLISDGILMDRFEVQLLRIDPIKRYDLVKYFEKRNIKDIDLAKISNTFLENPLYLKFLIFLHEEESVDFTQVNVFDLYQKFIAKIVERYCHKYNQDYNPEITISTEKFLKNHRLLALLVVFGKETVLKHRIITNYDNLEKEFKCVDVKLGIVKYFCEGYPIFIHQTFAEFMAMEWLNTNLFQEPSAKIIYEKIYLECDMNVRYLFDNMVCHELPLHKAILNDDLETVERLCMEDDTTLTKTDKCGRIALHLASSYCVPAMKAVRYKIVEVIIAYMVEKSYDLNTKDVIMNWHWIDCFAHKNIDIIEEAFYYNLPSILDVCLTGQETQFERYLDVCYRTHLELCFKLFERSDELLDKRLCEAIEIAMTCERLDIACQLTTLAYFGNESKPLVLENDSDINNSNYKKKTLFISKDLTAEISRKFKFSPLHISCMTNDCTRSEFYMKSENLDVNQKDMLGRIALHYCVIRCGLLQISNLIDHISDINSEDEDRNTPLHFACRFSKVDVVTLLLAKGADVNRKNKHGETALHFAIYNWVEETNDSLAVTEVFAKNYENIAKPSKHSKSLLWVASYKGFAKVVQILLDNGANPKEQSLLWIASYKGFANIVQILLNNGANAIEQEPSDTALHWAASKGHKVIFETLIRANKNLLYVQNNWGQTPIDVAVLMRKMDIIKCWLQNSTDLIGTDLLGNTIIHVVAQRRREDVLEMLLREKYLKRSDLKVCNHKNQSPLHLAVAKNNGNIIRFLLENGVEVNPTDENGCSPLHYSTSALVTKLLLARYNEGISAETVSNSGKTPLHTASEKGFTDVVRELLEANFDISRTDNSGCTPLHLAVTSGKLEAASILLQNGADIDVACENLETCLHKAVVLGNSNIMKFLLKNGAKVHLKDVNGNTPLHLRTLSYRDTASSDEEMPIPDEIVNLLLKHGADPYAVNNVGESSVDIAKHFGLEKMFLCKVKMNEDICTNSFRINGT